MYIIYIWGYDTSIQSVQNLSEMGYNVWTLHQNNKLLYRAIPSTSIYSANAMFASCLVVLQNLMNRFRVCVVRDQFSKSRSTMPARRIKYVRVSSG